MWVRAMKKLCFTGDDLEHITIEGPGGQSFISKSLIMRLDVSIGITCSPVSISIGFASSHECATFIEG